MLYLTIKILEFGFKRLCDVKFSPKKMLVDSFDQKTWQMIMAINFKKQRSFEPIVLLEKP